MHEGQLTGAIILPDGTALRGRGRREPVETVVNDVGSPGSPRTTVECVPGPAGHRE